LIYGNELNLPTLMVFVILKTLC